jgi:hypothetical protein
LHRRSFCSRLKEVDAEGGVCCRFSTSTPFLSRLGLLQLAKLRNSMLGVAKKKQQIRQESGTRIGRPAVTPDGPVPGPAMSAVQPAGPTKTSFYAGANRGTIQGSALPPGPQAGILVSTMKDPASRPAGPGPRPAIPAPRPAVPGSRPVIPGTDCSA